MYAWGEGCKNFLFTIGNQLKYTPPQPRGMNKLSIHNENLFEYTPPKERDANFLIDNV